MTLRHWALSRPKAQVYRAYMPADESEVDSAMLAALARARVPPRLIYAFHKTGIFVDAEGYKRLALKDRRAWDEALEEFDRMQAAAEGERQ